MTEPLDRIIEARSLQQCLECGKCSASCPRMVAGKEYSPRLLAHKVIAQREDEAYIENSVWECLTCGMCEERCPSGVEFSRFIVEMRTLLADTKGLKGYRAHDGALHSWMRIMTAPGIQQNRRDWVTPDLRVADRGKVAFFTGCAPYFDVFFAGIGVDTLSIARDSVRLLNFLDVVPAILPQERCCGHDLLFTGDHAKFEELCRLNYETFRDAGVEEVVVSCPECYTVLGSHLPRVVPESRLKVTLLLDRIEEELRRGGKRLRPLPRRATYQDPCRLARSPQPTTSPRDLLARIPGLTLAEMESSGRGALCCGNNGFINCDAYSKKIQIARLTEARQTGADLLITSCPKCMIHLTCAMRDRFGAGSLAMEVRDLVSVLADRIQWAE